MKLQFEANQAYQLEAMQAIVDVFKGQPLEGGGFEVELHAPADQLQLDNELLVGNHLALDEDAILGNVRRVQERFNAEHQKQTAETGETFSGLDVSEKLEGMHFSVEMETGTGKTYVYLRTIHELQKTYGFKKFIIVVPSIAIKEGVMKNLQITKDHFALLYNNPEIDFYLYDPKKRGQLKNFATTNALQVLVITIDSFAKKDSNIIYQQSDWGVPIEYVKAVRPIVIVDEPQNMETPIRRAAVANLDPLCTLRFSATHKHPYNLLYKLDPVRAYDLGLVKKIEVDSVFSDDAFNDAYLRVLEIKSKKTMITATVEIDKSDDYGLQRKAFVMRVGDDLYELSGRRDVYKNGYVLEEISVTEQRAGFANGKSYMVGQKDANLLDEIMKHQIKMTVQNHLAKELRLKAQGIKVLSLFFIDRVANYRAYGESGWVKGKFARWFEEIYREFQAKPQYQAVMEHAAEEVHNGYFSQDKKTGSWKDSMDKGGEGGSSKDDEQAYELIMKDKERLLDIDTPLRFIFSHSALREGWDNPNVFQICTLNETHSEVKKRQEIGRGLRLPVNQQGERVIDETINILTVIPNESYESFARALQTEIEEDCGVSFTGRIKKAKDRRAVRLRKGFDLDPSFQELWEKIRQKTRYQVHYRTKELIEVAAEALKEVRIAKPRISNIRVRLQLNEQGVKTETLSSGGQMVTTASGLSLIPDVLSGIQNKTKLTKSTILDILGQAGKLRDILINPQQLMDEASRVINETLRRLMVDGIKYERIAGQYYDMTLFENAELLEYFDRLVAVRNQDKTLYDHVVVDSETVERPFAEALDVREDVKFYFKLPRWFKIDTPIGGYNPDWALVFEGDRRVYFVAETKGTERLDELTPSEKLKILCGRKHFDEFADVRFEAPVVKLEDMLLRAA